MALVIYHRLIRRDLRSALDYYEAETIWIAVLRHDRRHPGFGLRRQK